MRLQSIFSVATMIIGLFISIDYSLCNRFRCRGMDIINPTDNSGGWSSKTHTLWTIIYIIGLALFSGFYVVLERILVPITVVSTYLLTNSKGRFLFCFPGLGVEPRSPVPAMDQHSFPTSIVSWLFICQRHANRVWNAEKGAFVFCQLGCLDSRPHGCHFCVSCLDWLYCSHRKCNYTVPFWIHLSMLFFFLGKQCFATDELHQEWIPMPVSGSGSFSNSPILSHVLIIWFNVYFNIRSFCPFFCSLLSYFTISRLYCCYNHGFATSYGYLVVAVPRFFG